MIHLYFVFEFVDLLHLVIEGFLKGQHLMNETILELFQALAEGVF